jgi:hypothetical protein
MYGVIVEEENGKHLIAARVFGEKVEVSGAHRRL